MEMSEIEFLDYKINHRVAHIVLNELLMEDARLQAELFPDKAQKYQREIKRLQLENESLAVLVSTFKAARANLLGANLTIYGAPR